MSGAIFGENDISSQLVGLQISVPNHVFAYVLGGEADTAIVSKPCKTGMRIDNYYISAADLSAVCSVEGRIQAANVLSELPDGCLIGIPKQVCDIAEG